ncbi:ATP-binding protein [Dongia sp.]|uniref:ATP-binding protein n=1 Tax=Dongia sp. TaxID=1977262 RepID=UPI0035B1CB65
MDLFGGEMSKSKYKMTISRLTIDKLGVKLYDKASAVIAELVANGYDADATEVTIEAPMGTFLAQKTSAGYVDNGYEIVVEDNGFGMDPDVINDFFLKVGAERRLDTRRGDETPKGRRVMGRKGVGKLAPFGICQTIEVISSGGVRVPLPGGKGRGYRTAHFILRYGKIRNDIDTDYVPDVGKLDQTIQPKHGTMIILRDFIRRQVPDMDAFARQMAQRFGVQRPDWKITLIDTTKLAGSPDHKRLVTSLDIEQMPSTTLTFEADDTSSVDEAERAKFVARGPNGKVMTDIAAGFQLDGRFYPVKGWMAYSKTPYRDDIMAGVRIYCRGKIAAQTSVFNQKAGFTGEHSIRSYLVGELEADWLDEGDDLIQTDRRDVLWSEELGQAFEAWGRSVVKTIGTMARDPFKKKAWDTFKEVSKIEEIVKKKFPGTDHGDIRDRTIGLAKLMAERMREDELADDDHIKTVVQLSIALGPHISLDEKLREAASEANASLEVVANILQAARVAELSSYGLIAENRVKVIDRIRALKNDNDTAEDELQKVIEEAPWLVNPQWSPITANQSLSTFAEEFATFYKEQTGDDIVIGPFGDGKKRPDFIMSAYDAELQIIEIKKPKHSIVNAEWDRVQRYYDLLGDFLDGAGNEDWKRLFGRVKVTIVCDGLNLSASQKRAFESYSKDGQCEHITWTAFFKRTEAAHKEYARETERQRKLVLKD